MNAWQDLAELIASLPRLRSLIWACREQIPLDILRALNLRSSPECHLHMLDFQLQSMIVQRGQPCIISAEDHEIATSPCLHSISTIDIDDGHSNWMSQVMYEMIAGAAPNLKVVNYAWQRCGSNGWTQGQRRLPKQDWQPGTIKAPTTRGSLTSLEIMGGPNEVTSALRTLQTNMDFAALVTLKLHGIIETAEMSWLRTECRFPLLLELAIGSHDIAALTQWIIVLPPLIHLELACRIEVAVDTLQMDPSILEALNTILMHCGRHLKSFHCDSATTQLELIERLQESCPYIENLELRLIRRGNAMEVAEYSSLGKLVHLRQIHLSIHAPVALVQHGPKITRDKASYLLRRLAIDENLARAIFRRITSCRPAGALKLLHLRMEALKEGYACTQRYRILEFVARSWICTTTHNTLVPGECSAKMYFSYNDDEMSAMETPWLELPLAQSVVNVWPACAGGDLASNWHSFPLPEIGDCDEGPAGDFKPFTAEGVDLRDGNEYIVV